MPVGMLLGYPVPNTNSSEGCKKWVAKVVSVQGSVQVRRAGETQWIPVKLGDTYCPGDMIRVRERSRAAVLLPEETILRLDQKTTVIFDGLEKGQTSLLDLLRGAVYFFSRIPRALKLATPFVNGAVEGTEFFVRVGYDQTLMSVFEGRIAASNKWGSLLLKSGQSAIAKEGKGPTPRILVRPRDAVQWALYYPPLIEYRVDDFEGEPGAHWEGEVRRSIRFYWAGDLVGAFESLTEAPENIRDPRFFVYRAALLLSVGRVHEAKSDIQRALNLDENNSQAFALQSIVAVVGNEKDRALELARKAVKLDPKSPVAMVALSYAEQANFDLESALRNLQEAVRLAPENALTWARLSELWLSLGYLDKALEVAWKALALNPKLARTQTVLGFAYLSQIKTKESKAAFEKAIQLDQAAPLPRLGLGLAKIRESDLKEGREDIEIAVSLDPNNALLRSYLGKAFFEEKRNKLAMSQYDTAKDLDPLDPTPYFYDAIRKQSVNRPVEALHDLQKSIELNDNRAVWRSRLLLDEDLAARSASLARVYRDLGFEQLALVEGWKSLNIDPGNYSAHRFLADSYSSLPRHEIARVSELLQSQLLQPINMTPVQPRLAEGDLLILEAAGPTDAAFNEFNPLFLRNRLALQASGVTGENDTLGGEAVQSGVWGTTSYSIGAFRYNTDGFRENNDLDQEIYNVFVQKSLSHKTSLQAEYRHFDREQGQLDILFDPDISIAFRKKLKREAYRFGFHHRFSPRSDIIGSLIHQRVDIDQNKIPKSGDASTDFEQEREGFIVEFQYLLRTEKLNLISGIGHTDQELESTTIVDLLPRVVILPFPLPPTVVDPPPGDPIKEDVDFLRTNIYAYSQINLFDSLSFTFGLSADFFERGKQIERDQVNPKVGLTWHPLQRTTFRMAAFRELGSRLFFSQTIEPTQVAGFNQFFDDINGTDSWRYGAAVEHVFSPDLFGGLEYSLRELNVPLLSGSETEAQFFDWNEQFGRVYLYWTPHTMVAISAEYQYERFEREENPLRRGIVDARTHRLPLGFNFFHPSGLVFNSKATYYEQSGDFQKRDSDVSFSGRDDFWVVDLGILYRLPKRFGLISVGVKNLLDEG